MADSDSDDDVSVTGNSRDARARQREIRQAIDAGNRRFTHLERLDDQLRERQVEHEERRERMKVRRETQKARAQILAEGLDPVEMKEAKAIVNKFVQIGASQVVKGGGFTGQSVVARIRAPGDRKHLQTAPSSANPDTMRGVGQRCTIINCEMHFQSSEAYWDHVSRFQHSPCNPCLYITNGTFNGTHTTHVCPACTSLYMDKHSCAEHMRITGHRDMLEPLYVTCYACPQCLMLFSTKDHTLDHMHKQNHKSYLYAFVDDGDHPVQPIPMPGDLPYAYIDACRAVDWTAQCVKCDVVVPNRASAQEHISKKHKIISTCSTTPADVFIQFLRGYTCVQCHRLFAKLPDDGLSAVHKCSADIMGMIVEYECRSINEFVCRLALEPHADPNKPGFGPTRKQREKRLAPPRGRRDSQSPTGSLRSRSKPDQETTSTSQSGSRSEMGARSRLPKRSTAAPRKAHIPGNAPNMRRPVSSTQSRPPDSRGTSEETINIVSLFDSDDDGDVTGSIKWEAVPSTSGGSKITSGGTSGKSSGTSGQETLTSRTEKPCSTNWPSQTLYNSDSSATVTPVLESSAESTPPLKTGAKKCSSSAMIADIQNLDTVQSRTSPLGDNGEELRITKVEKSPVKTRTKGARKSRTKFSADMTETSTSAVDGKKGHEGMHKKTTRTNSVIEIPDSPVEPAPRRSGRNKAIFTEENSDTRPSGGRDSVISISDARPCGGRDSVISISDSPVETAPNGSKRNKCSPLGSAHSKSAKSVRPRNSSIIQIRDSVDSVEEDRRVKEGVTQVDSDEDEDNLLVATLAGQCGDESRVISSQSEVSSRTRKRVHPRDETLLQKRARRNGNLTEMDVEVQKSTSVLDMDWEDLEHLETVPLAQLRSRRIATAKRHASGPSSSGSSTAAVQPGVGKTEKRHTSDPSGGRVMKSDKSVKESFRNSTGSQLTPKSSHSSDTSNKQTLIGASPSSSTPGLDSGASGGDLVNKPREFRVVTPVDSPAASEFIIGRDKKTDAQLEEEMMDRALKESLDLAKAKKPSPDRQSLEEERMLQEALKQSMETAKAPRALEGLTEEELLRAAIAESLKESDAVMVSDVEDGEIWDDDEWPPVGLPGAQRVGPPARPRVGLPSAQPVGPRVGLPSAHIGQPERVQPRAQRGQPIRHKGHQERAQPVSDTQDKAHGSRSGAARSAKCDTYQTSSTRVWDDKVVPPAAQGSRPYSAQSVSPAGSGLPGRPGTSGCVPGTGLRLHNASLSAQKTGLNSNTFDQGRGSGISPSGFTPQHIPEPTPSTSGQDAPFLTALGSTSGGANKVVSTNYLSQGARPKTRYAEVNKVLTNSDMFTRSLRSEKTNSGGAQNKISCIHARANQSEDIGNPSNRQALLSDLRKDMHSVSPLMLMEKSQGQKQAKNTQKSGLFSGANSSYQKISPGPPAHHPGRSLLPSPGDSGPSGRRAEPRGPVPLADSGDPDPQYLSSMKHVLFLDLDNWSGFFSRLPGPVPNKTFIWGFYGGTIQWVEPSRHPVFISTKERGLFHLHERCGKTKDATDFAIVLTVGRMDVILPTEVAFTILSGDNGFREIERQMKNSKRRAVVINPHHQDPDIVHALIQSVADA